MKRLLWWLLAGTKGGTNRARILMALHERPYNSNQLRHLLNLDYKTVRHHIDLLLKHNIIVAQGEGYGTMYFLSKDMELNYGELEEIWVRIGKTSINETEKGEGDSDE